MGLRLFTSLNAFNNTPEARELMARSWAAYASKQFSAADAITVEYFIKLPPQLMAIAEESGLWTRLCMQ